MAVALALWSLVLKPGKKETIVPQSDLRITNVALGDELADVSGRTSVKFTYNTPIQMDDDEPEEEIPSLSTTVLCSLIPEKIEQSTVDIILEQDEEVLFEAVGKNTVYLTGNYVDQTPPDNVPYNDSSDEEDAYDLREVSSDVEIDPDEIDDDEDRFEEIKDDETKKNSKRPRDSDAMETEEALSKPQQKKLNKKLKAESGKAIPAGSEAEEQKVDADAQKEKKEKKEKKDKGESKDQATKEVAGGVKIKDIKVGTGPKAKKGNKVSMRYIGKLANGKEFDSNTKGAPFTFNLGKEEVIKGWDEGIVGMQVGGERLLIIPPKMGYGNKKSGPIPAGSTLTFECKLVNIK